MTQFEKAVVKGRILQLSRLNATGKPVNLARRFEISERTVKRHIRELRLEGYHLVFDYYLMSYVLKKNECCVTEKKDNDLFIPGVN